MMENLLSQQSVNVKIYRTCRYIYFTILICVLYFYRNSLKART
jgi:hypothetical protein